jgi:PST family polysaccharide transporter
LRTDHLLSNLRGRAVSGGVITLLSQAVTFGVSLATAVVLGRLLEPADFGLVAMVTTITGFLRVFKDAGLSTATVQRENVTQAQVSNLFWVNVVVSASLCLLVAGLAPVVAWFYREPRLAGVTLALSTTFALSGAAVQHQALLKRQMRYASLALITICSAGLGLLVGIAMACLGYGYWSLVGMQLGTTVVELAVTLIISRWRPHLPKRGSGTRALLKFGVSLTVADVFRRIAYSADTLLIGRFYGATAVGLYSRGAVLLLRPFEQVLFPLESVFMPVLSRLQDNPERYRRTFLHAYNAIALVSFPAAGLGLALGQPVVLLLLGPKWIEVAPIFSWFTVAALFLPLYYAVMWLLNSQGRGKEIITTALIFSATTIGSFLAGLPFGPVGVAMAFSCVGLVVRLPILYQMVGSSGPVDRKDLWTVFFRYLPNWVVVFAVAWVAQTLIASKSPFLQVLICAPIGLLSAAAVTLGVPSQRKELTKLLDILRKVLHQSIRDASTNYEKP